MLKRSLIIFLALCLCLCGGSACAFNLQEYLDAQLHAIGERLTEADGSGGQSWAIYWYICGSDLESAHGLATKDLLEMTSVELPENVQLVLQTGGAQSWQNELVEAEYIERYLYSQDGLSCIAQLPAASMGSADTLADFLRFCEENYPADRTMVVFWNHGGGSVSGALFDENFGYDSMQLSEFRAAFESVYDLTGDTPPVDVIGFDSCLMATIDTAYVFRDVARYLVASQELMPGNGWNYREILRALAENPAMDGAVLGRIICDSYMEGCRENDTEDDATLSLTDLSRLNPLLRAYDGMGKEALSIALEDPTFLGSFGRAARSAESYGGNTKEEGYTNMVDLGHLARNSAGLLPETAQAVLDALEECVLYRVGGRYRSEATGLSCYYSYNSDEVNLDQYGDVGCSEAFICLYDYAVDGSLGEGSKAYLSTLGWDGEAVQELPALDALLPDGEIPVTISDDGYAVLDVGPEIAAGLSSVFFHLSYVAEEDDIILLLGRDNDLSADWERGIFMDNFRGVWGAIDGRLVYMEIAYEGDDYNLYSVPILLNGEEYNLRVVYDFMEEGFSILGARRGLEDSGMADRNLVHLQPGDLIHTVHYGATLSGDDEFIPLPVESIIVTPDTAFYEMDMGDGEFMMTFELVDAIGRSVSSEPVRFTVVDDNIYVDKW